MGEEAVEEVDVWEVREVRMETPILTTKTRQRERNASLSRTPPRGRPIQGRHARRATPRVINRPIRTEGRGRSCH